MNDRRDLKKFIDDSRANQGNIVFPDAVGNGRAVDVFLWHGSPDPPLVQRIGAWMFGMSFFAIGLGFVALAITALREDDSWVAFGFLLFISLSLVLIGIRVFCNGFPRRAKAAQKSS